MKVCEPKEKGGCYPQTCGAPVEAFDLAVWGQGRGECWDECGLSLQGSLERWSWESYSGRSFQLEVKRTKNVSDLSCMKCIQLHFYIKLKLSSK